MSAISLVRADVADLQRKYDRAKADADKAWRKLYAATAPRDIARHEREARTAEQACRILAGRLDRAERALKQLEREGAK